MIENPVAETLRAMRAVYGMTAAEIAERDRSRQEHRALFVPPAEALAHGLPDIADGIAGMLVELAKDPTPERCEQAQVRVEGLKRYVGQLREALVKQAA